MTDRHEAARAQRRARAAQLLEARFGPSWRSRVAGAFGYALGDFGRLFSTTARRRDAPSEALVAAAELLAVTPDDRLPPRWRQPSPPDPTTASASSDNTS